MPDEYSTAGALLGLHAQTPLHPGAGTALGTVDLPVQRERHTHWPTVSGSALKGVLRDACRAKIATDTGVEGLPRHDDGDSDTEDAWNDRRSGSSKRSLADNTIQLSELFGPPAAAAGDFAGALSVTDARLAAFPVRSLRGVFAWATCPAVLDRLARDARLAGFDPPPDPEFRPGRFEAVSVANSECRLKDGAIVLEEFEFRPAAGDPTRVGEWLAETLLPDTPAYAGTRDRISRHLVVMHDDEFTHFARYATEVTARIKLDYQTKTVSNGALFYQEFLPTETLFYAVVLVNPARGRRGPTSATELRTRLMGYVPPVLQIGGDETTGKGYCGVRLNTGRAKGGAE